jgi:hypothetical protein
MSPQMANLGEFVPPPFAIPVIIGVVGDVDQSAAIKDVEEYIVVKFGDGRGWLGRS